MNIYIFKDNHTTIPIDQDPVKGKQQVLDFCAKVNYTDGTLFCPVTSGIIRIPTGAHLSTQGHAQTIECIHDAIDRFFVEYEMCKWGVKPCPFCADTMRWVQCIVGWELHHYNMHADCPIGYTNICDVTREGIRDNWNTRK